MPSTGHPLRNTLLGFIALAVLCLLFADLRIRVVDPWHELGLIGLGFITPTLPDVDTVMTGLANTLAFAIVGLSGGALLGLGLARLFHYRCVRVLCAAVRSVHEIFWALIFLQVFGLSTLTGVLAILLPYTGTLAKVYAEILDERPGVASNLLPAQTSALSRWFFGRVLPAAQPLRTYTLYRLECSLRSSTILGFVGLPTLGFHLETAYSQGMYAEAAGLIYLFVALVAGMPYWARLRALPVYVGIAVAWLPWHHHFDATRLVNFFCREVLPTPLRRAEQWNADAWLATGDWVTKLMQQVGWNGLFNTLALTMIALVGTALTALVLYPSISPLFSGRVARGVGHAGLIFLRSLPEILLAFVLLLVTGPSLIPGIVALSWHNGAIIAHLIGRETQSMSLRPDAPAGIDRYAYEVTPRIIRPMLAFVFYRWEVILRESAILGLIGIPTLGFYVDSAFEELHFDRALWLILCTAALNIAVDSLSRRLRRRLALKQLPEIS